MRKCFPRFGRRGKMAKVLAGCVNFLERNLVDRAPELVFEAAPEDLGKLVKEKTLGHKTQALQVAKRSAAL